MQTFLRPLRLSSSALLTGLLALGPVTGRADCAAHSGPRTAALVELYTAEGCSSCPPADKQLGALAQTLDADAEVVPLALHVRYWDELGWPDIYAQPAFDQRQTGLVQANSQTTVYTPQFFVAGRELRSWREDLRSAVNAVNAQPAAARIDIEASPQGKNALSLQVETSTVANDRPAVLYLAVTENALETSVMRGENSGRTLRHEHVVHTWLGPLPLTGAGRPEHRIVPLAANWRRAALDVTAIVQDPRDGHVLQALRAQHCAAS